MSSRLADCLVRDRVLPLETVRTSLGRQVVYGGALDTILLEMGAIDETTLWGALSTCSGLPVPDPSLVENADPGLSAVFDIARWRICRAVPVGRHDDRLQLLCSDPPQEQALRAAGAELGLHMELFVAPEVRLRVAAQSVYGEPMPARFLRLLARLLGPEPVRRWAEAHAPKPAPLPPSPMPIVRPAAASAPPIQTAAAAPRAAARPPTSAPRTPRPRRTMAAATDFPAGPPEPEGQAPLEQVLELSSRLVRATASLSAPTPPQAHAAPEPGAAPTPATALGDSSPEEKLCRIVDDPRTEVRVAALRVLRVRLDHPRVRELTAKLRADIDSPSPERSLPAIAALAELRDPAAVSELIGHLKTSDAKVGKAVHEALIEITKQDFGNSRRRWTAWWERHQDDDRIDWLFEGLSHKAANIRVAACDELRLLTGEYFAYHFDLPKREREEARVRWESWWYETGRKPVGESKS